jgi:hypothetical protein
MDGTEGRRYQMLLPALGDAGLMRKHGAQILERNFFRRNYKQDRCKSDRGGIPPPPTPKRNCSPLAQRYTQRPATAVSPDGDNATDFFMGRLTLRRR